MRDTCADIGVAIVTPFQIPASAAMVRIHTYAKSLSAAGVNAIVYHHIPGRRLPCGDNAEIEQYSTFWSCGDRMLSKWRVVKAVQLIRSYFFTLNFFIGRRKSISVILLYAASYLPFFLFYRLLSWLLGFKLVRDLSEKPFLQRKQDYYTRLYLSKLLPMHDGVITISSSLRTLVSKYMKDSGKILSLPIMVDMSRFPKIGKREAGADFTLTYCGNIQHTEEMYLLFDVTACLKPKIPSLRLRVIGGIPFAPMREKELIKQYGMYCQNKVIGDITSFTGTVEPYQIPLLLSTSDLLLLPRPFRDYSDAGFPTKLGEYLASGRPVVTTATGDIADFLESGTDAMLISTDDADDIAEGVLVVYGNRNLAESLGKNGRRTAHTFFSTDSAGPVLLSYFSDLIEGDT